VGGPHKRFQIPGDMIARSTADLPDPQREALKWIAGYARTKNMSVVEIAARLKKSNGEAYSGHSLYAALSGRREEGQLDNLVEAIRRFRRIVEEPDARMATSFIETDLTRRIMTCCAKAFARKKLTFIWGESQIGKSVTLTEYARCHNHGETYLIRMPTGGTLGVLLMELANVLGIPAQQRTHELRRRIIESFDDRTLLIVDECHQAFLTQRAESGTVSMEFLREIYDRRKCGMVLCGTYAFRDAICKGPHARILRQLWLRRYAPLTLPAQPSPQDLGLFAAAFGLEPAPDKPIEVKMLVTDPNGAEKQITHKDNPFRLQADVITKDGLGHWVAILQEAKDLATEKSTRITWGRVIIAHSIFAAMEQAV
jgi:DNA transposition AAA+ family ATPase